MLVDTKVSFLKVGFIVSLMFTYLHRVRQFAYEKAKQLV